MNKQQAQQIIRDTFESSFDKNGFTGFIKNLLNRIEDASFTYQGNYIPDAYKQYIKTLERIGKFSDGENSADILVITLQKETSLERARTMQRNFIAWYLNGSRGGEMKEAALAAFVSPGEEDWRFSLVKMDYKFEKTKTGRMKVKEEFTPARRWSFLVGANEKSHTAQSRLVNILANDEQAPTLEEIGKSFDIETVTKEFFLKYRELFLRTKEELDRVVIHAFNLKKDFEAKGVDTVNFAKKLLGQIIFLYFLQKKGWFGVGRDDDWGAGSKQFLRELFEKKHGDYKNFFNDILEPLFYEALRIDRSHDDGYYSRFNCKIPFLNGGLFDPIGNYDWVHTDIIIPDKLFSNNVRTKEGDIGSGILDVFDRYNFTVKEDEPLEKEVAIDPELLGKSYEKFNAIRPDNYDEFRKALKSGKKGEENKFNKKFGVYYTPREIVYYMCQQSLINYLHTELNTGTTSYQKIGEYQTDAFGNKVRTDQLDLTVEHKSSLQIDKKDIEALIHTGEHVSENEARVLRKGKETKTYSHQLPESIRKSAKLIDEKLAEITVCDPAVGSGAFPVGMMSEIVKTRNVLTAFIEENNLSAHNAHTGRTIYDYKRRCIEHSLYGVDIDPGAVEIAKLRLWLSLVVDEGDIKNIKPLPNLDYKIVCGNSLLGVEKNLFNANLFSELEKIKPLFFNETNPTKKQEYKKQINDLISQITNGHQEFDFEVYFSEVFHSKGGFDVVIANPPYKVVGAKDDLLHTYKRKYSVSKGGKTNLYKLFYEKGLIILKDEGCLAFISPDNYLTSADSVTLRELFINRTKIIKIIDYSESDNIFDSVTQAVAIIVIVKEKVKRNHIFAYSKLGEEYSISYEDVLNSEKYLIKGFNKAVSRISTLEDRFGDFIDGWQGEINVSTKKGFFKEFHLDNSLPLVRGNNVGAYCLVSAPTEYCPANVSNRDHHNQARIVFQEVSNAGLRRRIKSTILNGVLCGHTTNYIIPKNRNLNIKFILAILNSCVFNYYFKFFNQTNHVPIGEIKQIPVFDLSNAPQDCFIQLVDRILAITKDDDYFQNPQKQAKVKALEAEIDQLVYKLYGLTPEEIKIVNPMKTPMKFC